MATVMTLMMKRRWLALCNRLGLDVENNSQVHKTFDDLAARYSEPHRTYHTLKHIGECLCQLDLAKTHYFEENGLDEDREEIDWDGIELTFWFHDAVYEPHLGDNEKRSAELVRIVFPELFSVRGSSFIRWKTALVSALVLATSHQENVSARPPEFRLVIDIDLAILGQPEARFDEYERQIQQEYSWVPQEIFAKRRSAILRSFLDRPSIYSTKFFRDKYEVQARQNIARSLAKLA